MAADPTAAPPEVIAADITPELVAQTLGQYLRGWWLQIRSGNSGMLPVILAMIIVAVTFQIVTPEHAFLRPSNLVYVFGLSTVYMVLAIAETAVLLLGEIDLSVGAVALFGGVIAFKLVQQPGPDWPWWAAILASLVCCGVIGALQGTLAARLKIPSFVVTLGGFLLFSGILVVILGGADGTVSVSSTAPNQTRDLQPRPRDDRARCQLGNPGGSRGGRRCHALASLGREATPGLGSPAGQPDRDQDCAGGAGWRRGGADLHRLTAAPPW